MKNGKSLGIDGIPTKIIKIDPQAQTTIIEPLFRKNMERGESPFRVEGRMGFL